VPDISEGEESHQLLSISYLLQILYQRSASSLMLNAPLDELLASLPEAQSQQCANLLDSVLNDLGLIAVLFVVPAAKILGAFALSLLLVEVLLNLSSFRQYTHLGGILLGCSNGVTRQVPYLLNHPLDGDQHESLCVICEDH
jgi:hypothetical protein